MGTAYKSILFVFFFLIPTLAVAQSPCTEQEMPGFIQLNQLEYLGFVMTGPAACVKASNQAAAVDWCGLSPRFGRAVNPANPQYGNKIDRGTLSYNPDEYYYCVKTSPPLENFKNANREVDESLIAQNMSQMVRLNDKRQLCNIANRLSPWLRKQPELRFVWSPKGEDGDCMCGVGGQRKLCDSEPPDSGAAELTQAPGPEQPVAVSVAAVEPANPTATSTPVDSSANVSAQLNTCAQEFIQDAQACKAESERAKNSCDQRINSNTGNDSSVVSLASGATQIMGQVFNMQNQASGMQAECFRAGAAANTATVAVNGMQERCEIDFSNCNRLCLGPGNESKVDEFKRVCAQRVNKTPEQIMTGLTTDNQPTADAQLFSSTVNAINQNIEDSSRICTVVAAANKSKLSQLADGIGRALQSSVQCACQTSSTGRNCQNIPPVQDCSNFPQPAGCGAYEALATCSVGAPGYDAKACSCMQNPAGAGCGGGSNTISAFSGPPIAGNLASGAPGGGGVSFSGGAGGGTGAGFSVAGNGEVENNDLSFLGGSKASGSGAPNNSISGGGGALGASGGGNGNATEDKGALAGEEEKGIGGIFNQAKTFMSNALGVGKKPSTAAAAGSGASGKPDMSKFKPGNIRGIAGSTSGMGSRNMDIWKMMNACTRGDTCKSNENNYLSTP